MATTDQSDAADNVRDAATFENDPADPALAAFAVAYLALTGVLLAV
jgi:hypothetical protein